MVLAKGYLLDRGMYRVFFLFSLSLLNGREFYPTHNKHIVILALIYYCCFYIVISGIKKKKTNKKETSNYNLGLRSLEIRQEKSQLRKDSIEGRMLPPDGNSLSAGDSTSQLPKFYCFRNKYFKM